MRQSWRALQFLFFHVQLHVSCMRKKSITVLMSDCSSGLMIFAVKEIFTSNATRRFFVSLEWRKDNLTLTLCGYSLAKNMFFITFYTDLTSLWTGFFSLWPHLIWTPKLGVFKWILPSVIVPMGGPECKQSKYKKYTIHLSKKKCNKKKKIRLIAREVITLIVLQPFPHNQLKELQLLSSQIIANTIHTNPAMNLKCTMRNLWWSN